MAHRGRVVRGRSRPAVSSLMGTGIARASLRRAAFGRGRDHRAVAARDQLQIVHPKPDDLREPRAGNRQQADQMAEVGVELVGRLQKRRRSARSITWISRASVAPCSARSAARSAGGRICAGIAAVIPARRSFSKRLRLEGFIGGSARRHAPMLAGVSFASVMSANRCPRAHAGSAATRRFCRSRHRGGCERHSKPRARPQGGSGPSPTPPCRSRWPTSRPSPQAMRRLHRGGVAQRA